MPAQVGQKAPDFQGEAVMPNGEFKQIKLSDYKGKWVVLFFYPLDFHLRLPHRDQGFQREVR